MKRFFRKAVSLLCAAAVLISGSAAVYADEDAVMTDVPVSEEDLPVYPIGGLAELDVRELTPEEAAAADKEIERFYDELEKRPSAAADLPYFFEFAYDNDYFYKQLKNNAERRLYADFYNAATDVLKSDISVSENFKVRVSFDNSAMDRERALDIINLCIDSNPQFFFFDLTRFYNVDTVSAGFGKSFWNGSVRAMVRDTIAKKTYIWLSDIGAAPSYITKIRKIVDVIADNVDYVDDPNDALEYNQTLAGAAYRGYCVCAGYTRMFVYLCHAAGIVDCVYIHATGHAYNAVKIGSNWYLADPTWIDAKNGLDLRWYLKSYDTFFANDVKNSHQVNTDEYIGFTIPDCPEDLEFPKGDINRDGVFSYDEFEMLGQLCFSGGSYDVVYDINGDGKFDMKDIVSFGGRPSGTSALSETIQTKFELSSETAAPGSTFTIDYYVEKDPGLTAYGFAVKYDHSVFELVSEDLTARKLFGNDFVYLTDDNYKGEYFKFQAYSSRGANFTSNAVGYLGRLTFRVKNNAPIGGTYDFWRLIYTNTNLYENCITAKTATEAANGRRYLTVTLLPDVGDVDNNGVLDGRDIAEMKKQLSESEPAYNAKGDVNKDGCYDIRDLSALVYMAVNH